MYGAILVSLVASLMALFFSGLAENSTVTDYNNETIAAYNKMAELSNQSEQVKIGVTQIKEKQNIIDIIGGFFSSAYQSLVITKSGVDTVDVMIDTAAADANIGTSIQYLRTALTVALIVAIFVGVFVAALLKWPI